jgi:hypothetical protein
MVATVSFNPVLTSSALGSFNIDSNGYIQGQAMDDPSARNWLAGGVLATTETLPMWGGCGVTEIIPSSTYSSTQNGITNLGSQIARATAVAAGFTATAPTNASGILTGFSVFDQAHNMINTPQSPVPTAGSGMMVNFYRLGSNARIAVACEPSLVSLQSGNITQQVSWDFKDQVLQPYDASTATYSVTSMTWSSTNGGQVAVVMAGANPVAGVGDTINVSGVTNTGTGALTLINTTQVVNTYTSNTAFTFLLPGTSTLWGTLGGTIVLNYGTGALNVRILDVQVGNSMTVSYNATTGFATWNRSGSCALILI